MTSVLPGSWSRVKMSSESMARLPPSHGSGVGLPPTAMRTRRVVTVLSRLRLSTSFNVWVSKNDPRAFLYLVTTTARANPPHQPQHSQSRTREQAPARTHFTPASTISARYSKLRLRMYWFTVDFNASQSWWLPAPSHP